MRARMSTFTCGQKFLPPSSGRGGNTFKREEACLLRSIMTIVWILVINRRQLTILQHRSTSSAIKTVRQIPQKLALLKRKIQSARRARWRVLKKDSTSHGWCCTQRHPSTWICRSRPPQRWLEEDDCRISSLWHRIWKRRSIHRRSSPPPLRRPCFPL
jgi:hypothetical protein